MTKSIFTEYFLLRLLIDIVSMVIMIRLIYFTIYHKRDLFAPFFLLNFIIFLLAYMLKIGGLFDSFGSGFGLLAAFSLLRFRTDTITMKDMTYLFIVMTIGLINSVMVGSYVEILGLNAIIIASVYAVDGNWLFKDEKVQTIDLDGLENIKPKEQHLLIESLRTRTGLDIRKIEIENIDFVKKKATIKIYYY